MRLLCVSQTLTTYRFYSSEFQGHAATTQAELGTVYTVAIQAKLATEHTVPIQVEVATSYTAPIQAEVQLIATGYTAPNPTEIATGYTASEASDIANVKVETVDDGWCGGAPKIRSQIHVISRYSIRLLLHTYHSSLYLHEVFQNLC